MKPSKTAEISVRFALTAVVAAACLAFVVCPAAAQEVTDSRDVLRQLGVDDEYFDRLADGVAISQQERDSLLRVIHRLRKFPTEKLKKWALDSDQLETALLQPKSYRGQAFRLRGRILDIKPLKVPREDAERYEMKTYYCCMLKLESLNQPIIVFTENVPDQWKNGAKPNAEGGALGIFMKNASLTSNASPSGSNMMPVFVAPRLAWYPNDLLGQLGMDVGLLDTVEHKVSLTEEEGPAFYEMLAAVSRAKPGELLRQAKNNLPKTPEKWRWTDSFGQDQYSIVPLFNDAVNQMGRLVVLRGTTRLIEKVHIEPEIAKEFGFDHYYNVMLVTADSQRNPLTFCVLELPKGMPQGSKIRYAEEVQIAGFFFKTWSYKVQIHSDDTDKTKTRMQLSPLLVGHSLVWRPESKTSQTGINFIVGGIFVAAMFIIWFVAWRSSRTERRWVDQAIGGQPDFGNIDEQDKL